MIPAGWRRSIIIPMIKGIGDRGTKLLSEPGKVFVKFLLDRIRLHLLVYQRPEQSAFTSKKSTVDRILALQVLIERRREFHRPFYYIDFRKVFDSVHWGTLWELLRLRGISPVDSGTDPGALYRY